MMQTNKNLALIQVLRGVASLLVVFLHATININEVLGTSFIVNFFTFGAAGVDIFFVLSGFIITYTSVKSAGQPSKLLPFLQRRAIRIFPTYWIIITGFLALQILLPSFYRTHFELTITNLASTFLLFPGHNMVNGVSWSLSYELFFYLIFSLLFLFPNRKLAFAIFATYTVVLIALPLAGYDFKAGNAWINVLTSPMNIEFFMGVAAALIIPYVPLKISMPMVVGGSIIFILCGVGFNKKFWVFYDPLYRSFTFGLASFLIVAGIVRYELDRTIKVSRLLILLGEASYSLYLLHLPIIVASIKIMAIANIKGTVPVLVAMLAVIAVTCLLSICFYRWIEKPMINKLNSFFGRKKKLQRLAPNTY